MRPFWTHYCPDTQGLIFVVDSNDRARIEEGKRGTISCVNQVLEVYIYLIFFISPHNINDG